MASTFGKLQEKKYQSDYIRSKTVKCAKNLLQTNKPNCNYIIPINHSNLIYGLYSKMDLENICTIATTTICLDKSDPNCGPCGTTKMTIDLTTPFYYNNRIDALGELFGNSQCGELNYTKYMRFFPNCNI